MSENKPRGIMRFLIVVASLIAVLCGAFLIIGANQPIKVKRITVVIKSLDPHVEFWSVLRDGIQEAAQEFQANVRVLGPDAETNVQDQIAMLEEEIAREPHAIVLAATDAVRLVPTVQKIKQAGIPVIFVDSGIADSSLQSSLIATDNISAGKEAGQALLRQIDGSGEVAIINYVEGAASLIDREQGALLALQVDRRITYLGTFYSDGKEDKAYNTTTRLLKANPRLKGIIGMNEPTSVGAGRAIRDMGLTGQVKLIGFDSSVNEVKLLLDGSMQGTIIQRPFNMGYLSIKTALQAIEDNDVPESIDTGSVLITKENMYQEENQKLLFPFVDR